MDLNCINVYKFNSGNSIIISTSERQKNLIDLKSLAFIIGNNQLQIVSSINMKKNCDIVPKYKYSYPLLNLKHENDLEIYLECNENVQSGILDFYDMADFITYINRFENSNYLNLSENITLDKLNSIIAIEFEKDNCRIDYKIGEYSFITSKKINITEIKEMNFYISHNSINNFKIKNINVFKNLTPNELLKTCTVSPPKFQDKIIKLPFILNNDRFVNYFVNNNNEKENYLLPVDSFFIQHYCTDKVNLSITKNGGSIYIEFSKNYTLNNNFTLNIYIQKIYNNDNIIPIYLSIVILPCIRNIKYPVENFFRIVSTVHSNNDDLNNLNMTFFRYDQFNKINTDSYNRDTIKNKDADNILSTKFYKLNNNFFDYIQIEYSGISAISFPIFKEYEDNNNLFSIFAVDFGSTNTHIEYRINNGIPQKLDYTSNDNFISTLYYKDDQLEDEMKEIYNSDISKILPFTLDNMPYGFPTRTILGFKKNETKFGINSGLFKGNILFTYDGLDNRKDISYTSDLKWDTRNKETKFKLHTFIDTAIFLIRCKALSIGLSLNKVKLVWFHPDSMVDNDVTFFSGTWEESFIKYLNNDVVNNISIVSESYAPFLYYKNQEPDINIKNIITIDIGGGTTDILININNKFKGYTSLKFVVADIFNDTINNQWINNNEIIKNAISKHTKNNPKPDNNNLLNIFWNYENKRKNNKANIEDFTEFIHKEPSIRLNLLIYYTSVLYYIHTCLKFLDYPFDISSDINIKFSGKGSEIFHFFEKTTIKTTFKEFTHCFIKNLQNNFVSKLKIEISQNPKEITAKGGCYISPSDLAFRQNYKQLFLLKYKIDNEEVKIGDNNEINNFKLTDNNKLAFINNLTWQLDKYLQALTLTLDTKITNTKLTFAVALGLINKDDNNINFTENLKNLSSKEKLSNSEEKLSNSEEKLSEIRVISKYVIDNLIENEISFIEPYFFKGIKKILQKLGEVDG